MAYDVGGIVRATQEEFRLFRVRTRHGLDATTTNRATPENLALLLASLDTFTDELVAWHNDVVDNLDWRQKFLVDGDEESLARIEDDLEAWQRRLDEYIFAVGEAPAGDRKAVLWSVTAPLLLGFYGGEGSNTPRGVADVATPFRIANELLVTEEFERRAFEQWQSDTTSPSHALRTYLDVAKELGKDASDAALDLLGEVAKIALPFAIIFGGVALLRGRR